MAKISFKPGNMLYPLPAVMVSVADREGRTNIITVAWAGTICTNPPMVSISVRPSRYSHHMILETGGFVINLTTRALVRATDYCGVRSGRDVDKWKEAGLTPVRSDVVDAPCIAECPVNIECRVVRTEQLGSHDMFIAEVAAVHVDDRYMDGKGRETWQIRVQCAEKALSFFFTLFQKAVKMISVNKYNRLLGNCIRNHASI